MKYKAAANERSTGVPPYAVAILGILGALLGALITGMFMLKTQSLQFEQAKLELRGASSQAELNALREIAGEYLTLLNSQTGGSARGEKDVDDFLKSSFRMLLWAPPRLAAATAQLNQAASQSLLGRMREGTEHPSPEVGEALAAWLQVYHEELADLRLQARPGTTDLETMILAVRKWLQVLE